MFKSQQQGHKPEETLLLPFQGGQIYLSATKQLILTLLEMTSREISMHGLPASGCGLNCDEMFPQNHLIKLFFLYNSWKKYLSFLYNES